MRWADRVVIGVGHDERVETTRFGERGHRIRNVHLDRAPQPRDIAIASGVGPELLLTHDTREDRRTEQLLGKRPQPLLVVKRRLIDQVRRHHGGGDGERRARLVLLRQKQDEQDADYNGRDDGRRQPPALPPHDGQIIERMDVCVFH